MIVLDKQCNYVATQFYANDVSQILCFISQMKTNHEWPCANCQACTCNKVYEHAGDSILQTFTVISATVFKNTSYIKAW